MKAWILVALASAVPAGAQAGRTIAPGMTEAEVRAAFGEPTVVRTAANRTYLFYTNGCPVRCGTDDVVFLESGRVVTAVLRAPERHFAGPGVTGLPAEAGPATALGRTRPVRSRAPAPTEGIRVQVPNSSRTFVGTERQPRRIVVGPRAGQALEPADGFRTQRGATTDTIRGPLQSADTAAALSPPRPVPGTPPASTTPARSQQQPPQPRAPR